MAAILPRKRRTIPRHAEMREKRLVDGDAEFIDGNDWNDIC